MAETIAASQNSREFIISAGKKVTFRATLDSGSSTLTPKLSSSSGGTFDEIDESGSALAFTASTGWRVMDGSDAAAMWLRFENGSGGVWTVEVL